MTALIAVLIVVLGTVVITTLCCDSRHAIGNDPSDSIENNTKHPYASPTLDIQSEIPFESEDPLTGNIYSGIMYLVQSPDGWAHLSGAYRAASDLIADLNDQSYEIDWLKCMYLETATIDSIPTYLTGLVCCRYLGVAKHERTAAIIWISNVENEGTSTQLEYRHYGKAPPPWWNSEDGRLNIIDEFDDNSFVWTLSMRPFIKHYRNHGMTAPLADPDSWWSDAYNYGKCTASETAIGCAAAAGTCMMSDEKWDDCVGSGCRASALSAIIKCSIKQIFGD